MPFFGTSTHRHATRTPSNLIDNNSHFNRDVFGEQSRDAVIAAHHKSTSTRIQIIAGVIGLERQFFGFDSVVIVYGLGQHDFKHAFVSYTQLGICRDFGDGSPHRNIATRAICKSNSRINNCLTARILTVEGIARHFGFLHPINQLFFVFFGVSNGFDIGLLGERGDRVAVGSFDPIGTQLDRGTPIAPTPDAATNPLASFEDAHCFAGGQQ